MNSVRAAGAFSARPLSFPVEFDRAKLLGGAGVLAALNAQADQIINALTYEPLATALGSLGGISAVIWVAMYVCLKVGFTGPSRKANRIDALITAVVVSLSLVPVSYASQVGLLLCAIYLLLTSSQDSPDRAVSLLLLSLTGPLLWGRILLHVLALPLLTIDARLVGIAIGTHVQGNTVQFAGSAEPFLIAGPCSSVHNMSLAIVLWTATAVLFRIRVDGRFILAGVAMATWMFVLNIARLAAIGAYQADFHFLHEGLGADLFGSAGLIGAATIAALAVISAVRRQG